MLEGNRANRLVCQHTLSASKRDGPGVRHHEDVMQDLTALVLRLMRSPARARSNLGIACVAVERGGVVLAPGTHDEMGRSEDGGPVHGFLLELCCRMSTTIAQSALSDGSVGLKLDVWDALRGEKRRFSARQHTVARAATLQLVEPGLALLVRACL